MSLPKHQNRRPRTLAELMVGPHDFAPTSEKRQVVGGVLLPATYYRCVVCGYREVEYWTPVFGKRDEFTKRREPV